MKRFRGNSKIFFNFIENPNGVVRKIASLPKVKTWEYIH